VLKVILFSENRVCYKVPRGTKTEIDKKDLSVSFFTAKKMLPQCKLQQHFAYPMITWKE